MAKEDRLALPKSLVPNTLEAIRHFKEEKLFHFLTEMSERSFRKKRKKYDETLKFFITMIKEFGKLGCKMELRVK